MQDCGDDKSMIDIVFPKNKEKEFAKIAEKLKYDELCFAYQFKGKNEFVKKQKMIEKLQKEAKIKLHTALVALPKNYTEAKSMADLVLIKGTENNAELILNHKPQIIFELENLSQKDFIYSRNSGLNNYACELAKKNKTVIGYSLASLKDSKKLGRIKQNIKLCRKHKAEQAAFSLADNPYKMRNPNDMIGLFIVLGMTPGEAKKSLEAISEKIKENKEKKKLGYIADGIMAVE